MQFRQRVRGRSTIAGFTLIEAMISTALLAAILSAVAIVTAQWLPNWNRGFTHVQQNELAAKGLERMVADLAAAEFIMPSGETKSVLFQGDAASVTFVRSALGPNTRPGLEFVRIAETADERGLAMVRMRARFVPVTAAAFDQLSFSDPVVLMRAPYRVSFSYAGADRAWRDSWSGALLPAAVRVRLRDAATSEVLEISTASIVHVNAPANCVATNDTSVCGTTKTTAAQ
jgi:general secretion pathway protein J